MSWLRPFTTDNDIRIHPLIWLPWAIVDVFIETDLDHQVVAQRAGSDAEYIGSYYIRADGVLRQSVMVHAGDRCSVIAFLSI